jgi:hypothetical protein
MTSSERRKAPRVTAHLLASFRCIDDGTVTLTGFVRTLNISEEGALLESPDTFKTGQTLALEFLLDYDRMVNVEGRVLRVTRNKEGYRVAVSFTNLTPANRRLLAKQVKN